MGEIVTEKKKMTLYDYKNKLELILGNANRVVDEIKVINEQYGKSNLGSTERGEILDTILKNGFLDIEHSGLYKELFNASFNKLDNDNKCLLVSRIHKQEDTVIRIGDVLIGSGLPKIIAGPCSVESEEQLRQVAESVQENGLSLLRGGAFKPRTSPYQFRGLGIEGLRIIREVADELNLLVVSEITNPKDIYTAYKYVDIIQIGSRNMQNFDLLKAAGEIDTPILLKRGMCSTIEEFILAAEYIVSGGNQEVILCERGIRTFEKWTRNTLDISAVPILKQETHLPVFVDISHSTGRRDILLPCAKAAIAAGCDGIMLEVHPDPDKALSDAAQQIDIPEFNKFVSELKI